MTERATDLRLLLAAVIAWAALAITLSWTLAHRGLLVAGLVLAVLAVVGAATHRREARAARFGECVGLRQKIMGAAIMIVGGEGDGPVWCFDHVMVSHLS